MKTPLMTNTFFLKVMVGVYIGILPISVFAAGSTAINYLPALGIFLLIFLLWLTLSVKINFLLVHENSPTWAYILAFPISGLLSGLVVSVIFFVITLLFENVI